MHFLPPVTHIYSVFPTIIPVRWHKWNKHRSIIYKNIVPGKTLLNASVLTREVTPIIRLSFLWPRFKFTDLLKHVMHLTFPVLIVCKLCKWNAVIPVFANNVYFDIFYQSSHSFCPELTKRVALKTSIWNRKRYSCWYFRISTFTFETRQITIWGFNRMCVEENNLLIYL